MNQHHPKHRSVSTTLVDLLADRALGAHAHRGYTFFVGDDRDDQWLRYRDLHDVARTIAENLACLEVVKQWQETRAKDPTCSSFGTPSSPSQAALTPDLAPPRAVVLCPPGPAYLQAMFGALYAGVIAVTAFPPRARRRDPRLESVLRDSGASIALVDRSGMGRREQIVRSSPSLGALTWIDVESIETPSHSQPCATVEPDSVALLQYTSGSTSAPKGVALTHRNLMANLGMIYDAFEVDPGRDEWSVNWLPPYHDMGLIGGLLQVMYAGTCSHVLPPASFVQKPIRWLRAIDRYRASVSGGPNFAFDACVDRTTKAERSSVDLSSWTLAFTGAEPIQFDSLRRFASEFDSCGFDEASFFPCYGLAEATLMVSGGPRQRTPVLEAPSPQDPSQNDSTTSQLVSCGRIVNGADVRIVDPETNVELEQGCVGEILVAGENVSQGYWNQTLSNANTFCQSVGDSESKFLKTGDLGYLRRGELFVSGRIKELIILRGRNFHPSDLESTATGCDPLFSSRSAAAFESQMADGEVGLVVVLETDPARAVDELDLRTKVRQAIVETHEIEPYEIVLVRPRSIPLTSSGKVKRLETQRLYVEKRLRRIDLLKPASGDGNQQASLKKDAMVDSGLPIGAFSSSQDSSPASSQQIASWLVDRIAGQLRVECHQIDANRPFVQFGLDSVSAVQITSELQELLGTEISPTLFYEAPNIRLAAEKLAGDRIGPARFADDSTTEVPTKVRPATSDDHCENGRRDRRIAIIGMACRLPACTRPDEFWRLLEQGRIAVTEPPRERERCVGPTSTTRRAGWIDSPDLFDASFFSISPREAKVMDPQHRLLLESSWRAIEDAGVDPVRLAGSRTGAFVGISNQDYERLLLRNERHDSTYAMTGNAASMAAHRLSYHLDLRGPSLSVDTACSSSLVALHQAVRSLQSNDCDTALVAGVNLLLSPEVFEALSISDMLSPEGLCRTFDAAANGYVRSEGCVAFLLKPLEQASADGDPVHAVIEGSSVNQDGQTNGITAPNGASQVRLYNAALKDAGLKPEAVTHVETHGTGTPLGDPIEVQSLKEVYGPAFENSDATPCLLGAVKANVGHLESAAGLVGLLKVVLELQHRVIVGQPLFENLSPHIDVGNSRLAIPQKAIQWDTDRRRIAAVSSFGFGGTNAHVLVGESPPLGVIDSTEAFQSNDPGLITLSARDEDALAETAMETLGFLSETNASTAEIVSALHFQKSSHRYRVAASVDSLVGLREKFGAIADKGSLTGMQHGAAAPDHPFRAAFLFSGQGGQHIGMGRDLYRRIRIFRQCVEACDELLHDEFGYGVGAVISSDPSTNGAVADVLNGPGSQTSLYILQIALTRTLYEWGICSNVVLGHSMGEYAAAVTAGVMTWQQGLRLTANRARAIGELQSDGTMAVIFDSADRVRKAIEQQSGMLDIAAIDGPQHVVVSGSTTDVNSLQQKLRARGTESRVLRIGHAFHSALIRPAIDSVGELVGSFDLCAPNQIYVSTLTGRRAEEELRSATYWMSHSRQPVQFVRAIETLAAQEVDVAIEIGPHPTLCALAQLNGQAARSFQPTLDRKRNAWVSLLDTVAAAYVRGAEINWERFHESTQTQPVRRVVLPGHPFHRKRFWFDEANDQTQFADAGASDTSVTAIIVGRVDELSDGVSEAERELLRRADGAVPVVDSLVAKWIESAFATLGIGRKAHQVIEPRRLVAAGSIAPKYERFAVRACEILAESGRLTDERNTSAGPGRWRATNALQFLDSEIARQVELTLSNYPALSNELRLASRCGEALPGILSGEIEPLTVLFPDGDPSDLEQLYRDSVLARMCNRRVGLTAKSALEQIRSRHPKRGIRVLEIGAGTGGTTSAVIPEIKDVVESYVFTDASPLLVAESASRFSGDSRFGANLTFEILDIETAPSDQGFLEHSYDLVIAANVLHATRDLRETLKHARRLLRRDGYLIALEGSRRERLLDLVFGITDGWWRFEDTDIRPNYPLLDGEKWCDLLRESGFNGPRLVPHEIDSQALQSQLVMLAGAGGIQQESAEATADARSRPDSEPVAVDLQEWIDLFHASSVDERRTALEAYLRLSVAQVLGYDPSELDLDQPVSNLGIDSLMAIQLKNRVDRDLDVSIPMVAFLQGKTIRQLLDVAMSQDEDQGSDDAQIDQQTLPLVDASPSDANEGLSTAKENSDTTELEQRVITAPLGVLVPDVVAPDVVAPDVVAPDVVAPDVVAPDAAEVKSDLRWQHGLSVGERILGPMSVGQLALWMIHQRSPLGPAYNFAFAARTASTIDLSALSKACQSLVRRHPVLRTTYRILDNQPVRVLSDQVDVVIGEVDCRDWRESQVVDWIRSEADRSFDLHHGPLIRFSLIRRRTGDVLAIAMHHIAADLWSMDVLVQELIDLYAMTVGGGTIELGPLPTTYDDYVAWEHQLEASAEGQRLWQFWRDKLADAPDVLSLPTTYPRPPEQTFNGNSVEWTVPAEVVDGLREVAHAERATMFTIVLAAYQAFLSRICNQDDLLVGTVSASRGQSDWEGLVGYFLNQLVLRTRIAGSPTYRELLRDTQREVLDALQNQAFPFAKLVQKLQPKRDASRSPLIQTMFIWDKPRHLKESHFAPGKSSDRLRLKPMLMEQRGAPFDLTLIVFELEDELKLTFRYNTDLFSKEAIRTLSESLQTLIEGIANDPDLLIRSARLLPTGQEGLIETWNDTDTEFDPDLSGDAFLRKWAAESPSAVAIESPIARMTYAEVEEASQNVANSLWQAGVRQGDRVAILAERGVESIVAILAVWRAGAAYVPLDPDQPAVRLQSMLDDANPRLLLVCGNPDRLKEPNTRCRVLSFHDGVNLRAQTSRPRQQVSADSPAYLIYTSGSTGRPKGAVLAHRGIANLALAQRKSFAIQKTDRCLQFASLGFDASVFEILMALHAGATLYVLDASSRRSTTTQITDAIRSASVTVATLPPTVLAALDPKGLTELRTVISAGELCSASIVDKWGRDREMFNAYGPTEATVWSTIERCSPDGADPSLGRPIANVRAYIVDDHLEPTPIGVPGELCLSGPGLALRYLNLPSLTSCAFVPNPFDDRFDATLYRTGDRARWTEDGKIEFLGRTDNQIKIDGNRIEPGEIAAVLNAFSDVDQAYVGAFSEEGRVVLAAYVITRSGSTPDWERSLRRRARKQLPSFMVPRHIIQVQQFPVTVHGKIDVSALPSPVVGRGDVASRSALASTPTEMVLAEIWCEVLGIDEIGIHDNFFDSGGASLQALGAADKAARRGFVTTAESMFRFQTIAELAADIDSRRHDISEVSPTPSPDFNPAHESNLGPEPDLDIDSNHGGKLRPEESEGARSVPGSVRSQSQARSEDSGQPKMVVESLGMYLPSAKVSTSEVIDQCVKRLDFPLERMTGIESRRVAGDGEFSIDLARNAAEDCLRRSSVSRDEIDLLIACNISRYDGPEFQVSYEPTTASKLKRVLGIDRAIAFDICNACAGFFTALSLAEQEMLAGRARRPMIVSGEYITHLTGTAQQELDGFMDPRLACLTLGDAGVAAIVGLSEGNAGFETLELYTAGVHHDLCVAKATDGPHGGAIMLTDAIKASAVTLDHSVSHAYRVLKGHGWKPSDVQHLIMHQTSATTLDGAVEELNRFYDDRVCDAKKVINNLERRGNTASTTHWVAVMDAIRQGRIRSGDSAAFAISGSGQTIGTALYRFDDLPWRITSDSVAGSSHAETDDTGNMADSSHVERVANEPAPLPPQIQLPVPRYGVKIVAANVASKMADGATIGKDQHLVASIGNAKNAAKACIDQAGWLPSETELLIHTGVYREEFLSEPAVAAILAGELRMNHEKPDADSRTTLAFDLADSQRGPLTAICLVADAIRIGRIKRGIVTASECENNSASLPQRGLAEIGSAIALERAASHKEGLVDVWFDSHPKYADRLEVATKSIDGRAVLQIRKSADFVDSMRECVARSVTSYLDRRKETIGSFDRVLISAEIGKEEELIAKQLGMQASRLNLAAAGDLGDPFTSGLAILWSALASESQSRAPQRWLMVSAGAGIEVACATYLLNTGEPSR